MPRSAFLEGARKAGGTETCTGAIAKQKTAEPQGAASLSLAVLESNGRKREVHRQCGEMGQLGSGKMKYHTARRNSEMVQPYPGTKTEWAAAMRARQKARALAQALTFAATFGLDQPNCEPAGRREAVPKKMSGRKRKLTRPSRNK